MRDQASSAESIFGQAIEIQSDADRAAFLDQACGHDPQLRAEVEQLVNDHFRAGSFLEEPVMQDTMLPTSEQVGSHIGPYKLRERLGQGGMGVVWAAEQKKPLRRKVALKVIKPGMDTSSVIARFETEREALSLMDHPNIARALDAGTTDQGRPYFVMELIRGVPITDYCDAHKLTVRERLELFTHVCKAIQHAHQKGIIHRDIKPSNVLITEQDGHPIVKVIDFGVAKALYHPLTDRTVYTGVFQAIGTLSYMSPEQAASSAVDVDTRADVYGLGVLLYELLTGATPVDRDHLERAAVEEACRLIRECEPPKPSTRISTLGPQAAALSQVRRTDPSRLCRSLRGDLDWIVMRAVEKDRSRRYPTAANFADDVRRHLQGEPVEAGPPSSIYRLTKLIGRNKAKVCAAVLLCTVFFMGFAGTAIGWRRANAALERLATASYKLAAVCALSGDETGMGAAREMCGDAQLSSSQITVLDALTMYTQGHFTEAYDICHSARQQGTLDFTARAVLAITCILAGHDDQYPSVLAELRKLETDELDDNEKLLMAAVMVYSDPDDAIRRLDELSPSQKSPLKLVVRAEARVHQSYTRGDVQLCEDALQDLERVQYIVGRNLKNQIYRLFATTYALMCAKRDNRTLDLQWLTSEGAKVEEWLRVNHPQSVSARHSRWFYLRVIGCRNEAWDAIREVGKQGGTWCLFVAIDRALSGLDPAQALQEFDDNVPATDSEYARLARLQMIAMLPNGRDALEDGLDGLPSNMGLLPSIQAVYLTCLLGDRNAVRVKARKLLQQGQSFEVLGTKDALECLAGDIDVPELLQRADDSHVKQCAAYFAAGMLHLCDGDRVAASDAFRRAYDTYGFTFFEHDLSQVYLKKLEDDPDWPYGQKQNR